MCSGLKGALFSLSPKFRITSTGTYSAFVSNRRHWPALQKDCRCLSSAQPNGSWRPPSATPGARRWIWDWDREQLSAYHADLNSEQRQQIQESIKSGDIRVVFTTNALEIGLDVGGLDGVILAGFPPSIMSAWQQIGRAGRSWDREAFVLFYAMNDPIDQFFVGNLEAFPE